MPPTDPLLELLDEARADEHGAARVRQRWLQRQTEEGATLAGTLLDLAERCGAVAVRTVTGRVTHGVAVALGSDFLLVRAEGRGDVCIRLAAVASVRMGADERAVAATGDRGAALDLSLVEVLAALAPERPRVILAAGAELVAGELRAVGADVVTLRLDGERRPLCYVAAAAVDEAVVERS